MWARSLLSLICLWLAVSAGAASSASTPQTVTLCADIWCPYNCTPGSSHPGFAVEIAQQVFGDAGYRVEYQELNWARCVEDARHGRFTGIIGAIHTDAPDFIFPTIPIGSSGDGYAVRAGDPFRFTGASSLNGKVLGVIRSYNFSGPVGAYIAAYGNDASRIEFVSGDGALDKNLAKLVAGRIDVVLDDQNVLRTSVADGGLKDRITVNAGPNVSPVFIAFSPQAPQPGTLAQILDAGVARLRASGRLQKILASYNVKQTP